MRYATVYTKVWHDEKFRQMNQDERILFLYLLTSPHSNMCGYYYLPDHYACHDLNWTQNKYETGMKALESRPMIEIDNKADVILILKYLKYNPIKGRNSVAGAISRINELPTNKLHDKFMAAAEEYLDDTEYLALSNAPWKPLQSPLEGASEGDEINTSKAPNTPFADIIDLYHKHCKTMTTVMKVTKTRKEKMRLAWRDGAEFDIAFFETLFKKAGASRFLTGQSNKWAGANFDWLIEPKNYVKVIEGYYDK